MFLTLIIIIISILAGFCICGFFVGANVTNHEAEVYREGYEKGYAEGYGVAAEQYSNKNK